jgi:hypothetical protein
MKDVAALLATVLVLFSLVALLSADYNRDTTSYVLDDQQERIPEPGYRFAFQR